MMNILMMYLILIVLWLFIVLEVFFFIFNEYVKVRVIV